MAVTRLERKVKRNRMNATKAQNRIKQLLRRPVIKNVDIEAIKASFDKKEGSKSKAKSETTSVEAQ
jgi:hypothetical protein